MSKVLDDHILLIRVCQLVTRMHDTGPFHKRSDPFFNGLQLNNGIDGSPAHSQEVITCAFLYREA